MLRVILKLFLSVSALGLPLVSAGCGGSILDTEANAALLEKVGETTVTVFPAFCRHSKENVYDTSAAKSIAAFLVEDKLAAPTISDVHVPIKGPWHGNQARMLRESAAAFADYLKANPIETDYALLPEYLFGRSNAGGIHCYVLDADGAVAYVVLQNSHHEPFATAKPKTAKDCTEVLIEVLRKQRFAD